MCARPVACRIRRFVGSNPETGFQGVAILGPNSRQAALIDAVERAPLDAGAWHSLALEMLSARLPKDALAPAYNSVQLAPLIADYRLALGWVQASIGDLAAAWASSRRRRSCTGAYSRRARWIPWLRRVWSRRARIVRMR